MTIAKTQRRNRRDKEGTPIYRPVYSRLLASAKPRVTCALTVVSLLFAATAAADASENAVCPNAALRTGQSARLPDCRAYEVVSPPESQPYFETLGNIENIPGSKDIIGGELGVFAATAGDRMSYFSTFAPPGSTTDGPYYLSTRGSTAWTTRNVVPPQSPETVALCLPNMVTWSSELDKGVLADGLNKTSGTGDECGADEPALVAGEPRGRQNLFVWDSDSGSYQLVNLTPASVVPANATFQAASSDLSRVVFDEEAKLVEGAPSGDDFYEWFHGTVHLITVLPDGTAVEGELADRVPPSSGNTEELVSPGSRFSLSASGSRVMFIANGNLYARVNAEQEQSALNVEGHCSEPTKACTVQVDASQAGGIGGGGKFMGASSDGALIYFSDSDGAGLTGDTVVGSGNNLYRYNLETGTLTDLTPVSDARVVGVSGLGEDGTHIYFVAEAALAEGAISGEPNVYMFHEGTTSFVASLSAEGDSCDWELSCLTARVSRNGDYIGFDSVSSGLEAAFPYNNKSSLCQGELCQEIFLYSAATGELHCASCDPRQVSPTAPASIRFPVREFTLASAAAHPQRNVSDTGQVFFDTFDQLPGAANGQSNVYEYENGQLDLLSSGTSEASSFFYEANATGKNVFFVTAQALTSNAPEGEFVVMDAREGGGFVAPVPAPVACLGEECQSPASGSPVFSEPGSVSLVASNGQPRSVGSTGTTETPAQIKAKKLAKALKVCRAKVKQRAKRKRCEVVARRHYGSKPSTHAKKRPTSRGR